MTITKTDLRVFTINATPEQSLEQYQKALAGAMPSDKKLNQSEVKKINALAHKEYAATVSTVLRARGIDGFTITEVARYWQGTPEKSYIITVATDATDDSIEAACDSLRHRYNQDAVMLTYPDGRVAFIEA